MSELLDISTVVDRDTVHIRTKKNPDGKSYALLNLEELGAYEHAIVSKCHQKARGLVGRTDRKTTPAEKRTITKALKDILALIVIDLEPHVLAELDQLQASRIVAAWAMKYASDDDGAAEGEDSASLSTTAGSSHDSKHSTAATRGTGSTSRGGS